MPGRRLLLLLARLLLSHPSFVVALSSSTTAATTTVTTITEVIGASGRIGSHVARGLATQPDTDDTSVVIVALPRGVCPGSVSSNHTPIFVCTPSTSWSALYEQTLPHRRGDLVFCGNGWLTIKAQKLDDVQKDDDNNNNQLQLVVTNVTYMVPHYSVTAVGDRACVSTAAPPTYLTGPHAKVLERLLNDNDVPCTNIASSFREWYVKAVQKLLWASCMWLVCHTAAGAGNNSNDPSHRPVTVADVHANYSQTLHALVEEVWPQFLAVVQQEQQPDSDNTTPTKHQPSVLSSEQLQQEQLPTLNDTLRYMKQYSDSIPTAIPSLALGLAELQDRNGVFAAPHQILHRSLVERVGGGTAAALFDEPVSSEDPSSVQSSSVVQGSLDRPVLHDLRPWVGLAVHGMRRPLHSRRHSPSASRRRCRRHIVVVGAGMLGCSVALNIARQSSSSLDVTVIDASDGFRKHNRTATTPSTSSSSASLGSTTSASWAWLNANRKQPVSYQHLNALGMHAWRCDPVLRDLPDWTGSLVHLDAAVSKVERHVGGSYATPVGPLTRDEWRRLEPYANFRNDDDTTGHNQTTTPVYSFPYEGLVDPWMAVERLQTEAHALGVTFVWNQTVTAVRYDESSEQPAVTTVECGAVRKDQPTTLRLSADTVVVAAGMGSAAAALGGLPLLDRPGTIAFAQRSSAHNSVYIDKNNTTPPASLSRILVDAVQQSHLLQRRDGTLVAGGGPLEVGGSSTTTPASKRVDVDDDDSSSKNHDKDDRLLDGVRLLAPVVLRDATLSHTASAHRPMPLDGRPAVGYASVTSGTTTTGGGGSSLYTLVSHSAITLGPLLGALAAVEIVAATNSESVSDTDDDVVMSSSLSLLEPYRPTRFDGDEREEPRGSESSTRNKPKVRVTTPNDRVARL